MGFEWINTTLGELCAEQGGRIQTGPFGSQLHASDYEEVGTPVVMPMNLVDGNVSEDGIARVSDDQVSKLARHQLRPDDIVFSRRGDVTRFALITERESGWLCGTGCLKISLGTERLANPRFIAGVLSLPETKDWLIQHAVGATMPNLNTGILSAIPMSLPGLALQKEVAEFLEAIKGRIDLLRQTNATLEAIAQALFKSWFGDFDPVRAKAEGREPEAMDAATAALFPSEFEESELGLIPKGWREATLGDMSTLNAESWSAKRSPDRIAYVDLSGVEKNRISNPVEHDFSDAPSRARRILRDGDSIIGTVRPGNRAFAYIHQPAENLTGSTGFAVLSPRDKVASGFIYLAATRNESIERLANLADGGAYPAVRPDVVSATPVIIPDDGVLAVFGAIVNPLLGKIAENSELAHLLAQLRDTLLPRLISGKLRRSETQALVGTWR